MSTTPPAGQRRRPPGPRSWHARLLDLLLRQAGPLLALLTVALLLLLLYQLLAMWDLQPGVRRLQLAFTLPRFQQVLAAWQAEGVALYREHMVADHVLALLYAAWGALLALHSRWFDGWPPRRRWQLAALMPLAAVIDLAENGLHLHLLGGAAPSAGLVMATSLLSSAKWLAILGFGAVVVWRGQAALQPDLALRVPPLALAVVMAGLMGLLAWLCDSPHWHLPWGLAALPAALGLGLAVAGVRQFRRHRTTVNPTQPQAVSAMVTGGVYRLSRNPMYLGMTLVLLAWALWLGRWPALALVPVFAGYLRQFQILPEEEAMEAQFGPAFRLYREQVRRWI